MPLGSVRYRRGVWSLGSKPMMRHEIPNGRTPPDWVYFYAFRKSPSASSHLPWSQASKAYLRDAGNVTGDVFDGDGVFHGQTMRLTLYPCLVDQDPRVGRQACGTPQAWSEQHS